jgi:hypothetical protein
MTLTNSPASERGIQSDLEGFYAAGPVSSPAKYSFLAQQANLYVSQVSHTSRQTRAHGQQTYRYVTLEYLQNLYSLQQLTLGPASGPRAVTASRELVAQDLLTVLHSLPIEAIGMYTPTSVKSCG